MSCPSSSGAWADAASRDDHPHPATSCPTSSGAWADAASRVRAAFARGFVAYETFALGSDEMRPLSNRSSEKWGGLAVTMVDALDTMVLMGLHAMYERSTAWLVANLPERITLGGGVPFFEVTIRVLGGLLSAHVLTQDAAVLGLASQLGHALLPAFADSPTGIPYCTVHLAVAKADCPESDVGMSIPLAELGSVQLEFAALASALHEPRLATLADAVYTSLRRLPAVHGLYPLRIRPHSGGPASKAVSFGSGADSFYETLLKRWVQGGKAPALRPLLSMYRASLVGLRRLLRRSYPSHLLFVARADFGEVGACGAGQCSRRQHVFEHLSCFLPGMLALGAHHGAGINATWEWEVAGELLATCEALYESQPSRLGPESVEFHTEHSMRAARAEARERGRPLDVGPPGRGDFDVLDPRWPLRPEYVESLYIMWRLEGMRMRAEAADSEDERTWRTERHRRRESYRQRGLRVFEAIEARCRTASGAYAGLRSVSSATTAAGAGGKGSEAAQEDLLESFFFAETLKYLYLLFSDDEPTKGAATSAQAADLDLDRFVFTTEAHLMPVTTPAHTAAVPAEPIEVRDAVLPPWWHSDGALLDEQT